MSAVIRKITPQTLPYLTQKADVTIDERFYADEIYLGKFDSEDNYREASQKEYENFLALTQSEQEL